MLERGERRRAARLVGEACARDPEQRSGGDPVEVQIFDRHVHVGGLGLAVEQDREVVWWVDLA